ncbi:hypothetical protein [Thiomicrorhabdus sp.]|uniref:site-specific integrase n=1 Tax=Thiomicrorhabdus sp. TaxID=2039724 RepID=UPI0029C7877A|nr:hypothetical protein [Thiomicrorhabdus sp.]
MMKKQDGKLLKCKTPPEFTQFKKGRWVYRLKTENGRKEIPLKYNNQLLREDSPCHLLYECVQLIIEEPKKTIRNLLDNYLNSDHCNALSINTLKGYEFYYKTIISMNMVNGKTFGDMPYELVTTGTLRKYLDRRKTQGVTTGANREIEFLSAAYSWAYERDLATKNPCKGVKYNKEHSREKYITDEEYNSLLELSFNTPLYFACEITYLCRARGIEAWNLKLDDIDMDKGVFIARTKGSLPEWTIWTPRLRSVINQALEYRKEVIKKLHQKNKPIPFCKNLILTREGLPYTKNARDSAWQRIYNKLVQSGKATKEKDKRFTFHDIKAKGVSDHELHESGHKTESAKKVYMRKVKEVEATK